LVWYLDLRRKFLRAPTWEEFKTELRIKFAQSPIRMSHLRKSLKSILYHESHDMERYISQFRSIEIQIDDDEMKFNDKLNAFVESFDIELERRIRNDRSRQMKVTYDTALNYANVFVITKPTESKEESKANMKSRHKNSYLLRQTSTSTTPALKQKKKSTSNSDTDSSDDELDILKSFTLYTMKTLNKRENRLFAFDATKSSTTLNIAMHHILYKIHRIRDHSIEIQKT